MAQYSSQTVANLRAILKTRGIPCTGLTRKQQIIDKLLEADNQLAVAAGQDEVEEVKEAPADQPKAPVEAIQAQVENINDLNTSTSRSEPVAENLPANTFDTEQHEVDQSGDSESLSASKQQPVTNDHNDAQLQEPPKPTESIVKDLPNDVDAGIKPTIPDTEITQEKSQPNTVDHGPSAEAEDAIKSLPTKDVEDDAKKRKRRSVTPSVSADEIANKRLKNSPSKDVVHLESDDLKAEDNGGASQDNDQPTLNQDSAQKGANNLAVSDEAGKHTSKGHGEITLVDDVGQQQDAEAAKTSHSQSADSAVDKITQVETVDQDTAVSENRQSKTEEVQDITPEALSTVENKSGHKPNGIASTEQDQLPEENGEVTPALHTATSALYIRNFMRPLQPGSLEEYLLKLAAAGESPAPDDLIQVFFIDSIRTHCFVCFSSVAAAKRVRTALHDQTWPKESSRRPLWVDFIPREKVTDWIKTEQNNTVGRSGVSIRWEVAYEESSDGMTAKLREIGSGRKDTNISSNQRDIPGSDIRKVSGNHEVQDSKSKEQSQKLATKPSAASGTKPKGTPESFLALDSLFKSTTAKPKLYFLPVSGSLADERLDELRKMTSSDKSRRGTKSDELYRYTFAKGTLVNDGPDRPPRRAPRPGRRRGFGGRGGHPPRWGGRGRYI